MLYAEHIEVYGVEFFRLACEQDLEGIVANFHLFGVRLTAVRLPTCRAAQPASCLDRLRLHPGPFFRDNASRQLP